MNWRKLSKVQITFHVCVNMNGSEKHKLLVSQNLKCHAALKILKTFQFHIKPIIIYRLHPIYLKKISGSEIKNCWRKREKEKKKLLLIDNCMAYSDAENLKSFSCH